MKRHSFEERLGLVKKVKSGYPIKRLAKESGVAFQSLKDWVRIYDLKVLRIWMFGSRFHA